jgi:hypothetical protein
VLCRFNIKTFLGYGQILTRVLTFIEVPFPTAFNTFISAINIVNLDFVPVRSLMAHCAMIWRAACLLSPACFVDLAVELRFLRCEVNTNFPCSCVN